MSERLSALGQEQPVASGGFRVETATCERQLWDTLACAMHDVVADPPIALQNPPLPMPYALTVSLPYVVIVALVGTTCWVWRGTVPVGSYAALSVLALLGLHRLIDVAADLVRTKPGGYYLEPQEPGKQIEAVQVAIRSMTVSSLVLSTLLLLLGFGLLLWMRGLLGR